MAKQITKVIQQEVSVTVCDVCRKELPRDDVNIDISWSKNCPYDNCYDDWGSLNFCSYEHFVEGAHKILDVVYGDEDFMMQRLTITASSTAQDGALIGILKSLALADTNQLEKGTE